MNLFTEKNGKNINQTRYIIINKKIELNYAEKQGKKDVNNRDENTYFASEDKKLLQKKIIPRLDIPIVNLYNIRGF
jgi:hypothetical protein